MVATDINELPDEARLWVYQANRTFSAEEKTQIDIATSNFLGQWAAHGQELKSAYTILHDRFIVIAVDESMHGASGCSIDASVGLIRNIEQAFGLKLLDRSQVAVLKDGAVVTHAFNKIKSLVEGGEITADTIVFNNAVDSLGAWRQDWKVPAVNSWMSRFF